MLHKLFIFIPDLIRDLLEPAYKLTKGVASINAQTVIMRSSGRFAFMPEWVPQDDNL